MPAIIKAAGALINEAVRMCPIASGTVSARIPAYSTMTVPATVAMPQVMSAKSAARDSPAK